jgi:hypothetical protein
MQTISDQENAVANNVLLVRVNYTTKSCGIHSVVLSGVVK